MSMASCFNENDEMTRVETAHTMDIIDGTGVREGGEDGNGVMESWNQRHCDLMTVIQVQEEKFKLVMQLYVSEVVLD